MTLGVLVDANVLIDIATDDPNWSAWATEALLEAGNGARLIINPIIYSEISVAFDRIEDLDQLLPESIFVREDLPWDAAFLAGKAHLAYRRRGGSRTTTLPDFFIGAHAAVREYAVITRDHARFETYFPTLEVISPNS